MDLGAPDDDSGVRDTQTDDARVDGQGPDQTPDRQQDADSSRQPDLDDDYTPPLSCVPNRDGRVDRAEMPLEVGQQARFATAFDATVDTHGFRDGDGVRTWDLVDPFPGERATIAAVESPDVYWFGEDFPTATYVTRLTQSRNLLGVFELTEEALLLVGVASPEDGINRTLLTHDPPAHVIEFPLRPGDSWVSESTVSGVFMGLPSVWTERYESEADTDGNLLTPFGTLPSTRVRTVLTQTVGLLDTVRRTHAFVSECLGTVGVIRSEDDESDDAFTRAAEVSRLAP